MGETVIINPNLNPNHSAYVNFLLTGSRYLNGCNKTANINVTKTVVYLQLINGEMTHRKQQK